MQFNKPTGLCFVCGKPTKLLIHQNCHPTQEKKQHNKKQPSNYRKGHLPSWMLK